VSRRLNKSVLEANSRAAGKALLCVDFGTALSKAAATDGSGYRPLLLQLGRHAEDGRAANRHVAQSSLFIDREKMIRFGHEAVSHWARQRSFAIARIDSMKRWFSDGPLIDLDTDPVDEKYLPPHAALTKGEALTLILAYVTDLAGKALAAAHLPRHVRRRFTRPVWAGTRAAWCDEHMARYLRTAQLVADSFSGQWQDGIALDDAKELISLARAEQVPDWLVEPKGVPEPIAAGHCRVERDYEHRYLALVIDVGAGTTDFAVFAGTQGHDSVGLTVATPRGETKSVLMAGDYLDGVLREEILRSLPASARNDVVIRQSEGLAREWKESLFNDGQVQPTFAGGVVASPVAKGDFLHLDKVKHFSRTVRGAMEEVLGSVEGLAAQMSRVRDHPLREITILASGGGAGLPMIRNLARRGAFGLPMRDAGPAPGWFEQYHRDEVPVFHQMAVAIGGAFPKLPGPPDMSKRPKRISL
jgi:molecular chaperone HscA